MSPFNNRVSSLLPGGLAAFLLLCPLAACDTTAPAQEQEPQKGRIDAEVTVDGVARQFIVYVPQSYTDQTAMPLVFMFHGAGGDGEIFYNISEWKEEAERENFIAMFPSALKYCFFEDGQQRRQTKWLHDGFLALERCEGQALNDDVAFVRLMAEYLQQRYTVDARRIYASGFSSGGAFVNTRLAREAADLLAAVSTVGVYPLGPSEGQDEILSAYHVMGEVDAFLLEGTGGQPLPLTEAALTEDEDLMAWIQGIWEASHLANVYDVVEHPDHLTLRFTTSLAGNDNEWRFSIIRGLGHRYPNGDNNPAGVRIVDQFWPFFQAHPKEDVP